MDENLKIKEKMKYFEESLLNLNGELFLIDSKVLTIERETSEIDFNDPLPKNIINLALQIKEVQDVIQRKENALKPIRTEVSKVESRVDIQSRIADLKKQFSTTGQQIIKLEQQVELIKQFRIEKNKLMSERINNLFNVNQFELFETTIDGTEKETCKTLVFGAR